MLTIAIPTYNRPEQLAASVRKLAAQVTDEVDILVLDNASSVPATESLRSILEEFPALPIKIERNPFNVGGNANILRCFERTTNPWIMVLGDDDPPHSDLVERAVARIKANPNALCINFKSVWSPGKQGVATKGRMDLLKRCPGFGNLAFISSNLYHAERMRDQLHLGHRYTYAMAPHIAMLLMSMTDDSEVVFLDESLVTAGVCDGANHWSALGQALSWPTLLELDLSPAERAALRRRLQLPSVANVVIQVLGTGLKRGEFETSKFYYSQVAHRLATCTPASKRFLLFVYRAMFLAPKLSIVAVNYVLKRERNTTIPRRLRRDLNDPHG